MEITGYIKKQEKIDNIMNYKSLFLLIVCSLLFVGCTSYKQAVYLRGDDTAAIVEQKNTLYEYRVMPKDELTITISTSDPAASVPFYRKIGQDRSQVSRVLDTIQKQHTGLGDKFFFFW